MLTRLCQLKSLFLLSLIALIGCTNTKSKKDLTVEELLGVMKNEWFKKNPQHALFDQAGHPQSHHYFDVNPELSQNDIFVNTVILTPEDSEHAYQLDLASGQRYYSHTYCPQSDVWNQYLGPIEKPLYTTGIIPRLLDQTGEPQKIIIFGDKERFSKLANFHEHRVKLIGAFVEQSCLEGNCLGKDNWIFRMVFIAVDPYDPKLSKVKDTSELTRLIEWEKVKASLENIDGRNGGIGGGNYPSIRIGKLIKIEEAMAYYKNRSIYISVKESKKIQDGCQALYDRLWTDVGVEQPEDKPARTMEELNQKVKLINELKKKKKLIGFAERFKAFTKKYYTEFTTCQRFVYAGNVNLESEKFWFLNYVSIYYRLHKEGYFYDCRAHTWQKNVRGQLDQPIFDIRKDIENCKERDLDIAMEHLPNFLKGLKNANSDYFRFVDYDNHTFGSHQKLYSWVKMPSKKYDCNYDPNIDIKKALKVFPEDISWKTRDVKDIEDELKIIY